jgi:dCTP deaminase
MGLKSDGWIRKMCADMDMIKPFEKTQVRKGTISYGLSSYGYDFCLSDEFMVPSSSISKGHTTVDPKTVDPATHFRSLVKQSCFDLSPGSFVLGRSVEYFTIPANVLVLCTGKSTYARAGLAVNITPLEPGWEGYVTIHLFNTGPLPVRLYAFEGIAQAIFIEGDEVCETSYSARKGKYQKQRSITTPRI